MFKPDYFKNTARWLWNAYQYILSGDADTTDVRRWLDLGQQALQCASNLIDADLTVAEKQKLQAALALIKTVLRLFSEYLESCSSASPPAEVIVGAGLSEEEEENQADVSEVAADFAPTVSWDDIDSAFSNRIRTGVVTNHKHLDVQKFLKDAKRQFMVQINQSLEQHHSLKVNTVLAADYVIVKDDEETSDIKYFNTKSAPIYSTADLNEWFIMNVEQPILTEMEEFQEQQSGWSLRSVLNFVINMNKFNPMRGSSYIELPDFIKKKRACVNVMNNDDQCFKWAILSAMHPASVNSCRVSTYKQYSDEYNFKGIEFPVDPKQVGKFEKQNDLSVNVYFLKKTGATFTVLPRHLTAQKKLKHVNLLIVEKNYFDENEEAENSERLDEFDYVNNFHYVWIKDLSRLIRSQLTKHVHRTFICDRCLHYFRTEAKLSEHVIDCEKINKCKIVLPNKKDSILQFKNFSHTNSVPYVIYSDFECLLEPIDGVKRAYQRHEAYSIGLFIKCSYDDQ